MIIVLFNSASLPYKFLTRLPGARSGGEGTPPETLNSLILYYIMLCHIISYHFLNINCLCFSICACHTCAGAMLIFSASFQF